MSERILIFDHLWLPDGPESPEKHYLKLFKNERSDQHTWILKNAKGEWRIVVECITDTSSPIREKYGFIKYSCYLEFDDLTDAVHYQLRWR